MNTDINAKTPGREDAENFASWRLCVFALNFSKHLKLLYLHFAVKVYEWIQQRRVQKLFYKNTRFKAVDQELLQGPNPYKIPAAFPYGETPLCSLKQIGDRCQLNATDRVVDLGCGRGRGVFFLADHYGCQVHGVDKIEAFVDRARHLAKKHAVPRVSFSCEDLRNYDFSKATCVFFYGTTFDDEFVAELSKNLSQLPHGSKIITVSYPLESFALQDQFSVSFPWGKGDVFIHHKLGLSSRGVSLPG